MDNDILQNVPDGKPVRLFLPLVDSKERYRINCILQKTEDVTRFNLLFRPGTLPHDKINTAESCIVSIDVGGPNFSLEAMITEISNPQALQLVVRRTINHEQMREFFRVDAAAKVISSSFQPTVRGKDDSSWEVSGATIDISGSGILASFSEEPPADKQVRLDLTLPNDNDRSISILARPIRVHKITENQYDVAYHFEDISTEDRDLIIGYCLTIQRQLLRLKVQVKGS